jgi:hypothetical protein
VAQAWHLTRRFVASLRPGPPAPADEAWARVQLLPGEAALWARMSHPDRRHAVAVARAMVARLGPGVEREVVAAALMHDSGKVESGLGTFSRVGATLVWGVVDASAAPRWAAGRSGLARRLGRYRLHPELGAELLAEAGAHPLTVAWAREHHLPPDRWTVATPVASVLKACDDD